MNKEKIGRCALCWPTEQLEKELKNSHFIPKSIYKYFNKNKADGSKLLIRTDREKKIYPIDRQVTRHLLCERCEGLMSEKGENYFAVNILKADMKQSKPSKLYLELFNLMVKKIWINWGDNAFVLNMRPRFFTNIDSEQIYHFAMGVFWKSSIDGWKNCQTLHLDKSVQEQIRQYLIGGDYVKDYIVKIVPSFWSEKYAVCFPTTFKEKPFFSINQFDFYLEEYGCGFKDSFLENSLPLIYSVDFRLSQESYFMLKAIYDSSEKSIAANDAPLTWM